MKFDQREHLRKIGRKGGLSRMRLYGNPGTKLGRSLGGQKSLQTHRLNGASPFVVRKILIPSFSSDLAEFIGIVLGDGGITSRQVVITLHKDDDRDYAEYVVGLVKK